MARVRCLSNAVEACTYIRTLCGTRALCGFINDFMEIEWWA